MVENLQRLAGTRSHGARLLAAHKDKATGAKPGGSGSGSAAYRGAGPGQGQLPFPVLVPPSPAVQSVAMPSRRDVQTCREMPVGGGRDDRTSGGDEADDEDPAAAPRDWPGSTSGKAYGVTLGKRIGGPMLGGSDAKRQVNVPSLFQREIKKQQAARLVPAGMVNLGNTCYLNSVIQVVLNMHSFAKDLTHPALVRLREYLPTAGVWAALRTTANKLGTASGSRTTTDGFKPAVEPNELRVAMGRRSGRWRGFAQQDAHEFYVELLEALQSEVLAAEGASSGRRKVLLSITRCPAARNLSGCLVHTWTCNACGRCTRTKEVFSCLSLQLPPQGSVKLPELVAEYLKDETIDKNCDGCSPSAPVAHTAQHHFWRLPRVLAVHIKRFMPLPQPQKPSGAAAAQEAEQWQERSRGVPEVLGPATATAMLATDDSDCKQTRPGSAPATPEREDPVPRPVQNAAAGPSGSTAPRAPSAPFARDTSPPAPYQYAKVHTAVEVRLALDLARHCDVTATAHRHLLDGVPPAALVRKQADDGAVGGGVNAVPATAAATPPSKDTPPRRAAAAGRTQGTPAGCTLDTAGGRSTCPSPSFMPNASALQERTVQGQTARKSRLGQTEPLTGCEGPTEYCETSAVSTGAQANGEAPTPHGGISPPSARRTGLQSKPGQAGAHQSPDQDGQQRPERGGFAIGAGAGAQGTPQAQLRPAGGGGCSLGHPTPGASRPTGGRKDGHTGNDDGEGLGPPPDSAGLAAGTAGVLGVASNSERKAPKAIASGSFFGAGGGELRSGQRGTGSLGRAAAAEHGEGGALPSRPSKRVCTEGQPSHRLGGLGAGSAGQQTFRSIGHVPSASTMPKRVDEMSEEEQLALALQMSLAGEQGWAAHDGSGSGAEAGSGRPCRGAPAVDLSVPTTAAPRNGSSDECAGAAGARMKRMNGARPSGGDVALDAGGVGSEDQGSGLGSHTSDNEGAMELQDESPGGPGGVRGGSRGGREGCRSGGSSPTLSGASGSRGEDNESNCSEQGDAEEGRRNRQRSQRARRKCRHAGPHDGLIPDVAESPAGPPPKHLEEQRKRRSHGSYATRSFHDPNVCDSALCRANHEDDGTTALSPVSGSKQRGALDATATTGRRNGGGGSGRTQPEAEGPPSEGGHAPHLGDGAMVRADPDPYALLDGDDEDPDMAAALRMSMETFAAEEAVRKSRDSLPYEAQAGQRVSQAADAADGAGVSRTPWNIDVADDHRQIDLHKDHRLRLRATTWLATPAGEPLDGSPSLVAEMAGTSHRSAGGVGATALTGSAADTIAPRRKPRSEDERWQQVLALPDADQENNGAGGGSARMYGIVPSSPCDSGDDVLAPKSPGTMNAGRRGMTAAGQGVTGTEATAGRGSGIDALMAAAGLDDRGQADQPASTSGKKNAGGGSNSGQFRFDFPLAGSGAGVAGKGAGVVSGAVSGPGTHRDDPVDLTGEGGCGDDDDAELNKAIMLSLQEAKDKEGEEWMAQLANDAVEVSADNDGTDGVTGADDAILAAVGPAQPKVLLQADSDDEGNDPDRSGGVPAACGASAADTTQAPVCPQPVAPPSPQPEPESGQTSPQAAGGAARREGVPLSQAARYRLHGVVRHKGYTPFSGHYVADVLIPTASGEQMWFEHNDAVVSHVDFARVREDAEKQGYMFFFVNDLARTATANPPGAAEVAAAAAIPLPNDNSAS